MDDKQFWLNLLYLFGIAIFWTVLDVIFGKSTDLTDKILLAFFIIWNVNTCAKKQGT